MIAGLGLSVSPVIIDHNDWTLMATRAPPTPVAEGDYGGEFDVTTHAVCRLLVFSGA